MEASPCLSHTFPSGVHMTVRKHDKKTRKSAHREPKGVSVQRPERRAGEKPVGDKELPRRNDLIDPVTRRGEVPIAVEDQDPIGRTGVFPACETRDETPAAPTATADGLRCVRAAMCAGLDPDFHAPLLRRARGAPQSFGRCVFMCRWSATGSRRRSRCSPFFSSKL